MHTHITEAQMARALGLAPSVTRREASYSPTKTKVRLSVRKDYDSQIEEFVREYTDTFGKLDAEVRAKQEAKRLGLIVWCVLEVV